MKDKETPQPSKLQLGCGENPMPKKDGWLNHDQTKHSKKVDVAFDLKQLPWPVEDGQFDEIAAIDVFEHIPVESGIAFLDECWRALKQGGMLTLQVPLHGSPNHLGDLTHHRGFALNSFDILDPVMGLRNPYTKCLWTIVEKKQTDPNTLVFKLLKQ